jgi:hypothetical protein
MHLFALLFLCFSLSFAVNINGITYVKGYLGDLVCVNMCFDAATGYTPIPGGKGIDQVALATDAPSHTIGCLKILNCLNGGWTLLVANSTGNGYKVGYIFDAASNAKVIEYVNGLTGTGVSPQVALVGYENTATSPPTFSIQSIKAAVATTTETVEGYLGDLVCVIMCFDQNDAWKPIPGGVGVDQVALATDAPSHTIGCLRIPACYNNGWTILTPNPAGGYMVGYHFDDDTKVKAFIDTLVAPGTAPKIQVMGTVDNSYSPALLTASSIETAPATGSASSLGVGLIGVIFVIFSLLIN